MAERYAPVHAIIRGTAASGEQELTRLWHDEEGQRLAGARRWIEVLAAKAPLRADLSRERLTDRLWLLMAPDHVTRLVDDRGWSAEDYEQWLAEQIRAPCSAPVRTAGDVPAAVAQSQRRTRAR